MTSKTRSFRLSPALVISCVALFLTLAGTAFAATVAKNSVRSAQIVDGTVRTIDLRDNAVSSAKVADETLTAADLGTDSVASSEIAENAGSYRSGNGWHIDARSDAVGDTTISAYAYCLG
jgi:hypothetical protein